MLHAWFDLLCDTEISTGLDSSTTFQIVKCTRNFSHLMKVRLLPCAC